MALSLRLMNTTCWLILGYVASDQFNFRLLAEREDVDGALFRYSDGILDVLVDGDGGSAAKLVGRLGGVVFGGLDVSKCGISETTGTK